MPPAILQAECSHVCRHAQLEAEARLKEKVQCASIHRTGGSRNNGHQQVLLCFVYLILAKPYLSKQSTRI